MKILTCNTGYFLGFDKPIPNYIYNLKRSCLGSSSVENERINNLAEIIDQENPEVVALQEVDQGSLRTRTSGQVKELVKRIRENYKWESSNKYSPRKIISHLPMFRKMSNGLLSRGEGDTRRHYLKPGSKQLMMEYRHEKRDLSVFNVHMPTLHSYRSRQLKEVKKKVIKREKSVLCGDFNCYRGKEELEELFDDTRYRVESPGPTHPRSEPHRELNLFIVPEESEIDLKRAGNRISDHFPVIADISGL